MLIIGKQPTAKPSQTAQPSKPAIGGGIKLAIPAASKPIQPATPAEPSQQTQVNIATNLQAQASIEANKPTEQQAPAIQESLATKLDQQEISKASEHICERLDQLQLDLMQGNPNIGEGLRIIHRALLEDPEQVTLLTTEQRAIFFQGLMKQTSVSITTAASKTKQTSKKEFKEMTVDDLL